MGKEPKGPDFSFFLNSKRAIVVITFVGELRASCSIPLKECVSQISEIKAAQFVVLNFLSVRSITEDSIEPLSQAISILRANYNFFTCGISKLSERLLVEHGIFRENENFPDLLAALQAISRNGANPLSGRNE